jgi:hypothetical protein
MRFLALPIVLGIIFSLAGVAPAVDGKKDKKSGGKIERSMAADPKVTITVCVMSGEISVRGWDKDEVRARSSDAEQLEFRRIDKTKDISRPANRIDVMVLDKTDPAGTKGDCQALANVELDVPQGATVQVQTRDGDISIVGVAAAYAGSQNGDIEIERAQRLVEAGSVGGSISLKDSSGRINLSSAGGGVEATNVRATSSEDSFEVGTVSGDIQLEGVSNAKVIAKTVNGNVMMSGPLTHSGHYAFTTMSGDVTLALPPDASFQLNAKVSQSQEIVSDFALTFTMDAATPPATPKAGAHSESGPKASPKVEPKVPPSPAPRVLPAPPAPKSGPVVPIVVQRSVVVVPYAMRRITAVCGSGDATIYVASFGGTLHLQKK